MARHHQSFSSLAAGETFRYQGRDYKKINGDTAADCRYADDSVTYPIHAETRVEVESLAKEPAKPEDEARGEPKATKTKQKTGRREEPTPA